MFVVDATKRAGYYKYLARLNYEAALSADDSVGSWPGYEIAAPPPVMVLCGHAIELSLKSILLEKGVSEKAVERKGHALVKLWERCEKLGVTCKKVDRRILAILADLLTSGRLRYGDKSKLGRVPVFGPLSELCEVCLELANAPSKAEILAH